MTIITVYHSSFDVLKVNIHVQAALFFHKIDAKNQGCGLSMDTSLFGVLKNLIDIHKTL